MESTTVAEVVEAEDTVVEAEVVERLPVETEDAAADIVRLDDRAIINAMQGAAIEDYAFSFKQGGKLVEGLTLEGINEAANQRGGIDVELISVDEEDTCFKAMVKATDTLTGSARIGAYLQPKEIQLRTGGVKVNEFAYTMAVHKAQRNAVKQLLPVPVLKRVLAHYLGKPMPPMDPVGETQPLPKGDVNQRACFAAFNSLKAELNRTGITDKEFWTWVKERYGVESRSEMSPENYAELASEMNAARQDATQFGELTMKVKPTGATPEEIDF
jgi:hypothetical protein